MTFLVTIRERVIFWSLFQSPKYSFLALKCPVLAKVEIQNSIQMQSLSLPSAWGCGRWKALVQWDSSISQEDISTPPSLPTRLLLTPWDPARLGGSPATAVIALPITPQLSPGYRWLPRASGMILQGRTFFGHWSPLRVYPEKARTSEELVLQGATLNKWLSRIDRDPALRVDITLRYILYISQNRRIELRFPQQ